MLVGENDIELSPFADVQDIRGLPFPAKPKYGQFFISGPPGVGKSTLIQGIGGWPYEGYLDLAENNWWRARILLFRPRELQFGLPFVGITESLSVIDQKWLSDAHDLEIDFRRILLPPEGVWWTGADWRQRFVFEFLLPNSDLVFRDRKKRARSGIFPFDTNLSADIVSLQISVYRTLAAYFWKSGLKAYIRTDRNGPPMEIIKVPDHIPVAVQRIRKSKTTNSNRFSYSLLEDLFSPNKTAHVLQPSETEYLLTEPIHIPWDAGSFSLHLGGYVLEVRRDLQMSHTPKTHLRDWLIIDPNAYFDRMSGFIRIASGKSEVLGRDEASQQALFNYPNDVSRQHISIVNKDGELFIEAMDAEVITKIVALDREETVASLRLARKKNLALLWKELGHTSIPVPSEDANLLVQQVKEILADEPYRVRDSNGLPGGLVQLPDQTSIVFVGDLHAQCDNLIKLLTDGSLLSAIKHGTTCLVLLGDVVHSDIQGQLEEMQPSMAIIDLFLMLKKRFPANVFCCRGNHESYSPDVGKSGVSQGLLFRKFLQKERGKAFAETIGEMFENLPYVIRGKDCAACHGAPTRGRVTEESIINIRRYPGIQHEITWNRLRGPNRPAGYTKGSVVRFRKSLGLPKDAPLIVGHTSLIDKETVWMDVNDIVGHHVVYSSDTDRFGAILVQDGTAIPLEILAEPASPE
jgi:hypothetical protein